MMANLGETGSGIRRGHDVETDVGWKALNSPPPAHKDVLTLRTASRLKEFKKTVDGLTVPKKGAINDMGFGALHSIGGCKLNRDICQLMVENFDVESCSVKIDGRSLCVNEGEFNRVMGVPCGESEVELEGSMEHPSVRQLMSKLGNDNYEINIDGLKRIIEEEKEADQTFKVAFILYAFALVLCPTTPGRVESSLIIPLVDVNSIHTKNWASFCFRQLVKGVGLYKNNTDEYMSGCVLFLQLLYFDSVCYSSCIVPTSVAPVVAWTRGRANSIIKWILGQGGFTSKGVFGSRGNCATEVWKKETVCRGIEELSDLRKGISWDQMDWDAVEAEIGIVNSMLMSLEPNLGILGKKLTEIENSGGEQNVSVIENIVVEVMKALKDNGYCRELEGSDVDTMLNAGLECHQLKTNIDPLLETREFSTCPLVDTELPASREVVDDKRKNKVECKADPRLFEQGQESKMVCPEIGEVKNSEPTATSGGKISRKDSKKLKFLLGNAGNSREEVARFADTVLFLFEINCLVPRTPVSCKIIDIITAYLFVEDSTSWFFPASFGEQAISMHNNSTLSIPIGSIISASGLWRFHRKLKRCKKIFLPLQDLMTGDWFLLVMKLDEQVAEIWDSTAVTLASTNRVDHAKAAMSLLQKVFASEMTRSSDLYYNFTLFALTFPQGNPTNDNQYDSGIYVIRHMQHYRQNWFAGFNSDSERRMIALEIVNNPKNEVINRVSVGATGKKRQNLDGEGTSKEGGKVKKPRQGPCASAFNMKINAHVNPPTGRKCRSHRKRRSRAGIV